uniref:Ig-like domain-containing protein n=1 Tax=Cyprinus carpio TaxID=7962 RepID=A0A8C2HV06_CYPCA
MSGQEQYFVILHFFFNSFAEICKTDLLEGTSCTIKLPTKNTDKSNEIRWVHLSGDALIHRKNGRIKKPIPGLTMEEDGSLKFESVSLKNSGKYKYIVYNSDGTEIDAGEKEITTVHFYCSFKDIIIQNENNPELLLTSAQVQENKTYSCSVSNPVSNEQSNSVTVSCKSFLFHVLLTRRQTPDLSHTLLSGCVRVHKRIPKGKGEQAGKMFKHSHQSNQASKQINNPDNHEWSKQAEPYTRQSGKTMKLIRKAEELAKVAILHKD